VKALFFSASVLCALGLGARPAAAFCRTTTCDPSDPAQNCQSDDQGCVTSGSALFWSSSCVTVGIQSSGSPRNQIDYETFTDVAVHAFDRWANADCGDALPSIRVNAVGPVACDASEYNDPGGNANVLMFRDDEWPYPGSIDALGISRVRFDRETGEIWDVDIEINGTQALSAQLPSEAGAPGAADLTYVIAHEAGHLLGLSHTRVSGATMRSGYQLGVPAAQAIAEDDVTGICAIYPPNRTVTSTSCTPRHGFSSECGGANVSPSGQQDSQPSESGGCNVTTAQQSSSQWTAALWALAAVSMLRRRK
jgi:hypothetical protein